MYYFIYIFNSNNTDTLQQITYTEVKAITTKEKLLIV